MHALFDVDLEVLLLFDRLLAATLLALVFFIEHLALATTVGAHRLHLLHHARSELSVLHFVAATAAGRARFCRARLTSGAITARTQNGALELDGLRAALIQVFEFASS